MKYHLWGMLFASMIIVSGCGDRDRELSGETGISDQVIVDIVAHAELINMQLSREYAEYFEPMDNEYQRRVQELARQHGISPEELRTKGFEEELMQISEDVRREHSETLEPIHREYEKRMQEVASSHGLSLNELEFGEMRSSIMSDPELQRKYIQRASELREE